ncbi:hypothetical protein [Desulfonatronospira sp.]|uniref:hypothetical protein n=1 Tax=Desulfonatronospira sp. TaxID=1962951 RepID=UPI0025BDEF3C|nr:hypothetical protein [Desulfonatronospira sp.]
MNPFGKALIVAALVIVVMYGVVNPQFAPVREDLNLASILGVLGGLFILVLLIERATEIAIAIWREPHTRRKKNELEELTKSAAEPAKLDLEKTKLLDYKSETKSIALLLAFSLSLVACAGGIGILDVIVDIQEDGQGFMRGVDIVLTSSLLAGGSDVFHQFVRALEDFFGSARRNNL